LQRYQPGKLERCGGSIRKSAATLVCFLASTLHLLIPVLLVIAVLSARNLCGNLCQQIMWFDILGNVYFFIRKVR
jgi:hypothetical protein